MRKKSMRLQVLTLVVVSLLFFSGCIVLPYGEEMQTPVTPKPVVEKSVEPEKPLVDYTVGERGPAGGYIVYDKGEYSDGWRFLEAAPEQWSGAQVDPESQWGAYTFNLDDAVLKDGLGDGLANSKIIVDYNRRIQSDLPANRNVLDAKHDGSVAAALCISTTIGGYSDWYLPSRDELLVMRETLYQKGKGSFQAEIYWSSSTRNDRGGAMVFFSNGAVGSRYMYTPSLVRPIRRF